MQGKLGTVAITIIGALLLTSCATESQIEVTLSNGEAAGTIVTISQDTNESAATSVNGTATGDLLVAASVEASQSYALDYYGIMIVPGSPADDVIGQLGTAYELYASSAEENTGDSPVTIYTYRDLILFVSPSDSGTDIISEIQITSPDITTIEGIRISDTAEEVVGTYGEGYTDNGSSISYESGSSRISFFFTGGIVTDIEYEYIGM